MIEYSEKKDLVEIWEILKAMLPQETEVEISQRIDVVIKWLQHDLIYDLNKSYRVSITLNSDGMLSILVTHDSKLSKDKNAWYYFHITHDTDTIVSILSRYAYSDDSVDGVFTKIIDADTSFNSDIDDCDYV